MDPMEMLHDRVGKLEEKIDKNTKDLYTKMERLFEKQDVKIMSLLKSKWKMKGGLVLCGFLFYGIMQIATIMLQKIGG